MKMLFFLSIILATTFSGCVTKTINNNSDELRSVFDHYKAVSLKSDSEQSEFFTEKMWKELQEQRSNFKNQTETRSINNFPNGIIVKNSMESIKNGKGCLIVQGDVRNGSTMDYNISFTQLKNRWVISDILVSVDATGLKRWLTEPICDPEERQLVWRKFIHQQFPVGPETK
jgi:hypothetical protein